MVSRAKEAAAVEKATAKFSEPEERTVYSSEVATPDLRDLLDMEADGLPVSWPAGLDERVARLVLQQRAFEATLQLPPD